MTCKRNSTGRKMNQRNENIMSKVKIAIIDNGVWCDHPDFVRNKQRINVKNILSDKSVDDCGHGTGIYYIISKECPFAEIINFKICNGEEVEEEILCACLEDILHNYSVDVINISMGISICNNYKKLEMLCEQLHSMGTIIVSAFDNLGSISYPAAFQNVIGVTNSNECHRKEDIVVYNDNVVNIGAKGGIQRIAWNGPTYIMMSGNSFACAHVTALVAQIIECGITGLENIINELRNKAKYVECEEEIHIDNRCNFKPHKAVIFPFNKEMHALVRYESMLDFEIVGVYDTKYSAHIGSDTKHILNADVSAYPIQNIENIKWEEFDTIILGHTTQLSSVLSKELIKDIVCEAIKNNKFIFSFDDISDMCSYEKLYIPKVGQTQLSHFRMGKLFRICKPVLGVFGTSSSQGKYTLQLELRKRFLNDGYVLGQIGTEPNSELLNMDYSFPIGYSSSVDIYGHDVIRYINYIINLLCVKKNADIVLVGSQSSVIPYDTGNLNMYPIKQYSFLLGTQPDAVIMCINPYDDMVYIKRSIAFLESLVDCKVIGLSMFPMDMKVDWSGLYGQKQPLSKEKYQKLKKEICKTIGVPVYLLGEKTDIDEMYSTIIDYFSNE